MVIGKESELEDAPAALYRSAVWDHFAFRVTYNDDGKKVVDKSATVWKHCATLALCANSNTTNMSAHLRRHLPSETTGSTRRKGRVSTGQFLLPAAFKQPYSDESDKAKCIMKGVGYFIVKAFCHGRGCGISLYD